MIVQILWVCPAGLAGSVGTKWPQHTFWYPWLCVIQFINEMSVTRSTVSLSLSDFLSLPFCWMCHVWLRSQLSLVLDLALPYHGSEPDHHNLGMVWLVPEKLLETLRSVLDFNKLNVKIRTHVVFGWFRVISFLIRIHTKLYAVPAYSSKRSKR